MSEKKTGNGWKAAVNACVLAAGGWALAGLLVTPLGSWRSFVCWAVSALAVLLLLGCRYEVNKAIREDS